MNKISKSKVRFIVALLLAFFTSCSKTETADAPDLKKEYFPLNPGQIITYQVDSVVYDKFNNSTKKFSFQIKDTVLTEVESGERTKTVYIERYKKDSPDAKWVFQKIISRTITDLRAEEFLDNQRFVRMVFPPVKSVVWNGNTYNNLGSQDYFYKSVDQKDSVNTLAFDSTAVIVQVNESNLLNEQYAEEQYAKNVGLIRKRVKNIEKDFYTQKTINGYIYTMEILSSK